MVKEGHVDEAQMGVEVVPSHHSSVRELTVAGEEAAGYVGAQGVAYVDDLGRWVRRTERVGRGVPGDNSG